jgi:hypothetical protein
MEFLFVVRHQDMRQSLRTIGGIMARVTLKSFLNYRGITRRFTLKILLSIFILTWLPLLWAEEIKVEKDGSFMVDLGPIPNNTKAMAGILPRKSQADPIILIFQNGYKSYGAPDSVSLACWEPYDSFYNHPEPVYFGVILGNFESTDKKVQLLWELAGTKNLKVRQTKTVPALRVVAYFIKKPLAATPGTYGLRTSLFFENRVIHSLTTLFFISSVI